MSIADRNCTVFNMEGIFDHIDKDLSVLKQECVDPVMSTSITDDLDLFQYLTSRSEGQSLDETVDLDVIPQPCYPSPNYESEGYPSPSGMEGGTSPVSTGGDSECLMSELKDVNFSDLLDDDDVTNFDNDGFTFNSLLKDAFEPTVESMEKNTQDDSLDIAAASHVDEEERSDNSVSDEDSVKSNEPAGYNFRSRDQQVKEKRQLISVIKVGNMPNRSTMTRPKVVKVFNRAPAKQKNTVDCIPEIEDDKNKKNAIQARINRQKKKAYIHGLEEQVTELSQENKKLQSTSSKLAKEKDLLSEEVAYLKNILANDSALSGLLQNIGNTPGVQLSTSFHSRKRAVSTDHDHDYGRPNKRAKVAANNNTAAPTGGICLHVDQNKVSLELCSSCAKMAKSDV